MKWAILPLIIVLALVELALRATIVAVLTCVTLIFGVMILESEQPGTLAKFLTPECFKFAERIVG